jgi:Tol biopolymer transport system component
MRQVGIVVGVVAGGLVGVCVLLFVGFAVYLKVSQGTINYKSHWAYQAAWSPNGRELAYTRGGTTASDSCTMAIWVRQVGGAGGHRLVTNAAAATWSPDGKRIAFFFVDNANTPTRVGIAVADANGSHRRQLVRVGIPVGNYVSCATGDAGVDLGANQGQVQLPISAPAWSPDGSLIAYSDTVICSIRANGHRHCFSGLCVIRPDGTHRRCFNTGPSWEPSWSPDSTRLAFLQDDQQSHRIELIDRNGRNLRVIRTCCRAFPWFGPVWSSRNVLAFGADDHNCLLSATNGSVRALNTRAVIGDLAWSPDGKQVAYAKPRTGRVHLLRVRPKHLLTPHRCGNPTARAKP